MLKRGLSPVVATLLLVALTVVIGVTIYSTMSKEVLKLAPEEPQGCGFVRFKAEVVQSDGSYYLDVVNQGVVELEGFVVFEVTNGEVSEVGTFEQLVRAGQTKRILFEDAHEGVYLIVPQVLFDEGEVGVCSADRGIEVKSP